MALMGKKNGDPKENRESKWNKIRWLPASQKYVDERNQCGDDLQDGKILKLGSIQSNYQLLQLTLVTSFVYGDQFLGIQHIISRQKGPAVKLEAQPWCTQCLWRSKRTNRRQPGMENSLGGKVSISWQNGIIQDRLHDPRILCQPLFSELIQSRSFEYFRHIGLVKNAMSSLQCGHLNKIFYISMSHRKILPKGCRHEVVSK